MSLRVNPSAAIVAACSGPRTIRSWLCEKYQPTFEPSDTAVSATVARIPAAPVDTWSFTLCGASPPNTVTALSPARSGPQGEASSRSAMQYVNFAGLPWGGALPSIARTRSSVGGTMGSPSHHSRSQNAARSASGVSDTVTGDARSDTTVDGLSEVRGAPTRRVPPVAEVSG